MRAGTPPAPVCGRARTKNVGYTIIAYIVMGYTVIAYIVVALYSYGVYSSSVYRNGIAVIACLVMALYT